MEIDPDFLTVEDQNTIQIINNVISGISIVAILYFFWNSAKLIKLPDSSSIIWHLMIADLLMSISNLLNNLEATQALCLIIGFIYQTGFVLGNLWVTLLGFYTYKRIAKEVDIDNHTLNQIKITFYVISMGIATLPLVQSSISEYYDVNDVEACYFKISPGSWVNIIYYFLFFAGIVCFLATFYFYLRIYKTLKENVFFAEKSFRHLLLYPSVFFISYIPEIILTFFSGKLSNPFLIYTIYISLRDCNGLFNAILYGILSTNFRVRLPSIDSMNSKKTNQSDIGLALTYDRTESENEYINRLSGKA